MEDYFLHHLPSFPNREIAASPFKKLSFTNCIMERANLREKFSNELNSNSLDIDDDEKIEMVQSTSDDNAKIKS